jgi:predicted DNA-binding protein with PD1-like motif
MQTRLMHQEGGQRTFALVFDTGDEPMSLLKEFAAREKLKGSQFSAIGAFSTVTLGYFDWKTKDYLPRTFDEQLEVASLTGDVALDPDGRPSVHVHCVLGRRDASALAGHLLHARVRPTLELLLTEQPAHLCKAHDKASGLALLDLGRSQ